MKRRELAALGTLEERVMRIVWDGDVLLVRDVVQRLGGKLAHTTVMTTLDRLHKKRLVARERVGIAFAYRAAMTHDEFHRRLVGTTIGRLLARSADPVLAGFVDAAADADEANLARLERLIAARRKGR